MPSARILPKVREVVADTRSARTPWLPPRTNTPEFPFILNLYLEFCLRNTFVEQHQKQKSISSWEAKMKTYVES